MPVGDIDSDERGTGARFNDGKPPLELTPLSTLEGAARVMEFGAKKYKRYNWLKGMAWLVPYGSLLRHLAAWYWGEENDDDSGLPHLDHAMCNLIMLIHYSKHYEEGDDRPKGFGD